MNVRTSRLGLTAVAVALAGTLTGCSSGSGSSSGGSAQGVADSAAGAPAPAAKPPESAAAARTRTGSLALQPALIRTAELTVVVADVTGTAGEAGSTARAASGVVAGDDRSGSGAHATLVLKVPPGRMDAVLDQLSRLGTEQSRSSSTEDVTEDVADIGSRVATMQASIARVRAILARAEKIGDVVSVEGELSKRTTELESLQARQRALAGQVGYATITLQLRARPAAAATPPADRSGFLGGLTDGWDAFTATVGALLTGIGAVLPFLLLLVPVALAVRWVLRRRSVSAAPIGPAPQPE